MSNENYHDGTLILNRAAVSRTCAAIIFLMFLVFGSGYFLGKKHAVEDEVGRYNTQLFADRIQYSLNTLYNADESVEAPNAIALPEVVVDNVVATENVSLAQMSKDIDQQKALFVAQLAGYGTKQAAQQFVERLARKGIGACVKERTSVRKKKTSTWYQVETEPYADRTVLAKLVEQLCHDEKLSDVRIIKK